MVYSAVVEPWGHLPTVIAWLAEWDRRNLPNMWHLLFWGQTNWGVDWEQKSLVCCKLPNKQNNVGLGGDDTISLILALSEADTTYKIDRDIRQM